MTTTGPNLAGTGADDATVGTITWVNPSRVTANDASLTTAGNPTGSTVTSHYIKATNPGFSIASDQQIDGIKVEIEKSCPGGAGAFKFAKDATVRLVIGGTVSGSNLADTSTKYTDTASPTIASYGGATELWGLAPTYSDVNSATFGAVLSSTIASDSGKATVYAEVDFVRFTIYHSTAVASGQPTTKRFGGVQFSGSRAPARGIHQWTKRVSGLFTPTTGRLLYG